MNWKRVALGFVLTLAVCLSVGAAQTAQKDPRNFWALNNTGKEVRNFYVSDHSSSNWGDDILGRATLPDGMGTLIYFTSGDPKDCDYDFKLVYSDGSAQVYTQGRNVCQIHAVEFNPDTSDAF